MAPLATWKGSQRAFAPTKVAQGRLLGLPSLLEVFGPTWRAHAHIRSSLSNSIPGGLQYPAPRYMLRPWIARLRRLSARSLLSAVGHTPSFVGATGGGRAQGVCERQVLDGVAANQHWPPTRWLTLPQFGVPRNADPGTARQDPVRSLPRVRAALFDLLPALGYLSIGFQK
jgi:hypothetical protein